jgi:2,4-dienoyl-CoA reductase (NADPH2)
MGKLPAGTLFGGDFKVLSPLSEGGMGAVPSVPVIAAGRIQTPERAEAVVQSGEADLVGLGRVLFADPLWPRKARGELPAPIVRCTPGCSLCSRRTVEQKPAYCAVWPRERRDAFVARVGG